MNALTITATLGQDADLLLSPDQWLENRRIELQEQISILTCELDLVFNTQSIKRELQQQNLVSVRCVTRDRVGDPIGIGLQILPLIDALIVLECDLSDPKIPHDISKINAEQQKRTWENDGYDIQSASRIAKRRGCG